MCDIGNPLEIIDVQPLSLPVQVRREQPEPPVSVPEEVPAVTEVVFATKL
jgi:hypothetical protein